MVGAGAGCHGADMLPGRSPQHHRHRPKTLPVWGALSPARTLPLSLSRPYTLAVSRSLACTLSLSHSHCVSLSLSHTFTVSLSLTHSLSHKHTQIIIHTHYPHTDIQTKLSDDVCHPLKHTCWGHDLSACLFTDITFPHINYVFAIEFLCR